MEKFELIEKLKEFFSEQDITNMFVYWLSSEEVERCVKDFLKDRDMDIKDIESV